MEKYKKYVSDYLFTTPSFLVGSGTVLNLAGNYYKFNTSESGFDADEKAIENDFGMIGQDLYDVMDKIKTTNIEFTLSNSR